MMLASLGISFSLMSSILIGNLPNSNELKFPFKENCVSVQKYFNNRKWNKTTKFQGFDKQETVLYKTKDHISIFCPFGYVTESSPLGTRVCFAFINFYIYRNSLPKVDWIPYKDKITGKEDCRWK